MSLKQHQQDWEHLGKTDPFWAVLSDNSKRYGKWDQDEFFKTGDEEIKNLILELPKKNQPKHYTHAMDFGCGLGRLTRALSNHFESVTGVDISQSMIEKASELNSEFPQCQFIHNPHPHLKQFTSKSFDLIYTNITLQHVPEKKIVANYIKEFLRLIKSDGIVVFQLPSSASFKVRLNIRRLAYRGLEKIGFSPEFLTDKLHLSPIHMGIYPETMILRYLKRLNGKVVHKTYDQNAGPGSESITYFVIPNSSSRNSKKS